MLACCKGKFAPAFRLGHRLLVLAVACSGIGLQCQVEVPFAEVSCLQAALGFNKDDTQLQLPGTERCKRALEMALITTGSKVMDAEYWLQSYAKVLFGP